MTELKDRIYAILKHQFGVLASPHDAGVVIEELGLRPDRVGTLTRWVTDWKGDDE